MASKFSLMTSAEFSPYKAFIHTLNLWWLVFLITLLGGVFGFIFFQVHKPVYEATATYFVTVDLTRFPFQDVREDLVQYNEDMAVNTTEGALLSPAVLNDLIKQLQSQDITLTKKDLLQNYTIERKHDIWELRYRSPIPSQAQTVVNTWAQIGYQAMLSWQADGKAPMFVVFQSPSLASIPDQPVLYGRNNLILAGALVGLIVGIVLSNNLGRGPRGVGSQKDNPPEQ